MTRFSLCVGLCALTIVVGLVTAIVQSHNRDLGMRLADLREEITLVESVNRATTARILALDHAPIPHDAPKREKVSR